MGDFRTHAVFIHYYVPVLLGEIVPYLPDDKKYAFVLSTISKFASTNESMLLGDGFPIYLRPLALSSPYEKTIKFCTYLKQVHKLDPDFLAANSAQVRPKVEILHTLTVANICSNYFIYRALSTSFSVS